MEDKKILVTGGAGFIGSHLVREIVEKNEILVIDNLKEGSKESVHEDAKFREIDIRNRSKLEELVEEFKPDFVFHLAAYNDAMSSIEETEECISANINGTVNLLEACKNQSIEKFVYASSGGLSYGEPEKIPTDESSELRPVYPYGVSKACGGLFISDYGRRYGINFAVLRLGSVYGPGANGGVIKNFFEKIKMDEKPVIYGDGSQTRDFIYVSDVVEGLIRSGIHGNGFYNLSTETQTSVKELLEIMEDILESNLNPHYEDRWNGDIDRCELSIDKAKAELGWQPRIELKEGLKNCKTFYLED